MEYDDEGKILRVGENTAALEVDIPLDEIPGVDPEAFEEECFRTQILIPL